MYIQYYLVIYAFMIVNEKNDHFSFSGVLCKDSFFV